MIIQDMQTGTLVAAKSKTRPLARHQAKEQIQAKTEKRLSILFMADDEEFADRPQTDTVSQFFRQRGSGEEESDFEVDSSYHSNRTSLSISSIEPMTGSDDETQFIEVDLNKSRAICGPRMNQKEFLMRQEAEEIEISAAKIQQILDTLQPDEITGKICDPEKRKEIASLMQYLELNISYFNTLFANLIKPTSDELNALFIKIYHCVCKLNENIFLLTSSLFKGEKYKLLDIVSIFSQHKELAPILPVELQIEIYTNYLTDIYLRFERNEIDFKFYPSILHNLNLIENGFIKCKTVGVIKRIGLMYNFIEEIKTIIKENTALHSAFQIKDFNFDINEVPYFDIVKNVLVNFQKGKIPLEDYKILSIKLGKIVSELTQTLLAANKAEIKSTIEIILYINTFLVLQNCAINVTPLLSPSNIKHFSLEQSIPYIVQSDLMHFYFEAINEIIRTKKGRANETGGDDYALLSEQYAKRICSLVLSDTNNVHITNEIFTNLTLLCLYAMNFYNIIDDQKRAQSIKNTFAGYHFMIPTQICRSEREKPYSVLMVKPNFIIYIAGTIHKIMSEQKMHFNPLKNLQPHQISSLIGFLNMDCNYDSPCFYPSFIREWIFTRMGCEVTVLKNKGELKIDLRQYNGRYVLAQRKLGKGYGLYFTDSDLNPQKIKYDDGFKLLIRTKIRNPRKTQEEITLIKLTGEEFIAHILLNGEHKMLA